ncbi:MAG: hypothetical protein JWO47_640 [Candidatus Saccharibacteria bacterium]|nr:hypothetical protein [Candidatus Saccharibacteria bacterium]
MKKKKTPKEYEDLGRAVASIFETGYLDKKQAYKTSFIKGVFGGLGGVIGATVLVALLIWILSLFSSVPLVGHLTDKINKTVESAKK